MGTSAEFKLDTAAQLATAKAAKAAENAALKKTPRTGGGNPLGSGFLPSGSRLDPVTGAMLPPTSKGSQFKLEITDFAATENPNSQENNALFYGIPMQFPLSLSSNARSVPHIKFKIYETEVGAAGGTSQNQSIESVQSGGRTIVKGAKDTAKDVGDFVRNNVPFGATASDFLSNAGSNINKTVTAITGIDIPGVVGRAASNFQLDRYKKVSKDTIILFMPDGLAVGYGQEYQDISLTSTLGTFGFLAQAVAAKKGNSEDVDPYVLEALSKLAGSEESGLNDLLFFSSTGKAINPQFQLLYKSPKLRSFNFDFRLVPRNANEALAINTIIKAFKAYAAPNIPKGSTGRYFIPPARFELELYHQDAPNNYLFKTKQCVLETIDVDYAPNGYATHADGAPVETRLSLAFKETSIISQDDILNGGY